MHFYKIDDTVTSLGVKDISRRVFDCLVYMPKGTTYNSYLIEGKTANALIDCNDAHKSAEYMNNIANSGIDRIDYIVSLHAEQDHSGSLLEVIRRFPKAKVVCTEKVSQFLEIHLNYTNSAMHIIKEGEILDLGGMNLTFYPIPFAHWPDNTMALLMPQNILFSSDLFGAHYTDRDVIDEIDEALSYSERSYFSEIMMPFRKNIVKYVELTRKINPRVIAPAHGAIMNKPTQILDLYSTWTSDDVLKKVTIPFVSMHDSIREAVECLAKELKEHGIDVVTRDIGKTTESLLIETGELIYDLVDSSAVIFAFPTVLGGPHPAIVYASATANAMMPKTHFIGTMCSFAWVTKATETVTALTQNFKGQRLDPLIFKGQPNDEDKQMIRDFGKKLADLILA